ncbi:MAG: hypothetical protein AAF355_15290 [Myxococcota bacterium]
MPAQAQEQDPADSDARSSPEGDEAAPFKPLTEMRADFNALMDDIILVRSRINALSRHLFDAKIRVTVRNRVDIRSLDSFDIWLDGESLLRGASLECDQDATALGPNRPCVASSVARIMSRPGPLFEGFAAPGPHQLTIELRAGTDHDQPHILRDTFQVSVAPGFLTEVRLILKDRASSDRDSEDDDPGAHSVHTRVRVTQRELGQP